ncbi:hypothetical protein SDC9_157913 [bioreactor metagenome]|uniref:Uncharacterized protein n=1 Tax=bioreactor metagenome TaxID=1076179 RepID=A0A645F8D8_9ZZZZ
MKNRYEILKERDVPAALDRRIMAAAALKARAARFRRMWRNCSLSAGAAAAALLVAGTLFLLPGAYRESPAEPTKSVRNELLALTDWSAFEQESYNLSFELYSGRQAVAELANVKIQEEY